MVSSGRNGLKPGGFHCLGGGGEDHNPHSVHGRIRLSGPSTGVHAATSSPFGSRGLAPHGAAVSTHPPGFSAGSWIPVAGDPSPPHRHLLSGRFVSVPLPRLLAVPLFGAVGPRGVRSFLTPLMGGVGGRSSPPRGYSFVLGV